MILDPKLNTSIAVMSMHWGTIASALLHARKNVAEKGTCTFNFSLEAFAQRMSEEGVNTGYSYTELSFNEKDYQARILLEINTLTNHVFEDTALFEIKLCKDSGCNIKVISQSEDVKKVNK